MYMNSSSWLQPCFTNNHGTANWGRGQPAWVGATSAPAKSSLWQTPYHSFIHNEDPPNLRGTWGEGEKDRRSISPCPLEDTTPSTSSDSLRPFTEQESSEASMCMFLSHDTGSKVFPARALTLDQKACLAGILKCLWSSTAITIRHLSQPQPRPCSLFHYWLLLSLELSANDPQFLIPLCRCQCHLLMSSSFCCFCYLPNTLILAPSRAFISQVTLKGIYFPVKSLAIRLKKIFSNYIKKNSNWSPCAGIILSHVR